MIVRKKDYKNAYFNGNPMTKKIRGVRGLRSITKSPTPVLVQKVRWKYPKKQTCFFQVCAVQRCNYNGPPPRSG